VQGSEADHSKIREQVVQYMEKHHDEFAPFVEDDEGFDKYLSRMRRVGSLMATYSALQVPSAVLAMLMDNNVHSLMMAFCGAEFHVGRPHGGPGHKHVF
jgi:hypothetical protein